MPAVVVYPSKQLKGRMPGAVLARIDGPRILWQKISDVTMKPQSFTIENGVQSCVGAVDMFLISSFGPPYAKEQIVSDIENGRARSFFKMSWWFVKQINQ